MSKTVLLQIIEFNLKKQFDFKQFSLAEIYSLNAETDLFLAIQFCISTQVSYIWPIDRALLWGPVIEVKERILCIPQSISIARISPSDCLVS